MKPDRIQINARVSPFTPDLLKALAKQLGFVYGGDGATGKLLDAIATAEVIHNNEDFVIVKFSKTARQIEGD